MNQKFEDIDPNDNCILKGFFFLPRDQRQKMSPPTKLSYSEKQERDAIKKAEIEQKKQRIEKLREKAEKKEPLFPNPPTE